jgi:magnesium transporter
MKYKIINSTGKISEKRFSRREISEKFDIHVRDLRSIYGVRQINSIASRDNCLIISLGNIKAVIGKNSCYLFDDNNCNLNNILVTEISTELKKESNNEVNFEFLVLEVFLQSKLKTINKESNGVITKIDNVLSKLKKTISDKDLEAVWKLQKELGNIRGTTQAIEEELREIIEDDDFDDFYLIKNCSKDDVEFMLEHFLEQIEIAEYRLTQTNDSIGYTQEFITIKLSSRRNLIIRYDLLATLFTLIVGIMTLITGIYGMNIHNGFEQNTSAFVFILLGLFSLFIISVGIFWKFMMKKIF